MYRTKYHKYKNEYLQLKYNLINQIGNGKKIDYKNSPGYTIPDLYLFFDLLQVSRDILQLTVKENFIILVGESPSYLKPFLEKDRQVFNLPFSNKPLACFMPPYSLPSNPEEFKKLIMFNPTIEQQNYYFEYLDKKTVLTKEFVQKNWFNIVLIDYSKGHSITGVSIFLNRYAGYININNECTDITGCLPLKFINLAHLEYPFTNINPTLSFEIAKKTDYRPLFYNYHPSLIIFVGNINFLSVGKFLFSRYPRYIPSYTAFDWNNDPYTNFDGLYNQNSIKRVNKFFKFVNTYLKYEKGDNKQIIKLLKLIKKMPKFEELEELEENEQKILDSIKDTDTIEVMKKKLDQLFDIINKKVLVDKYNEPK